MKMKKTFVAALLMLGGVLAAENALSQERIVPFNYGHFDQWVVRQVKESAVIGGNTQTLYEIGPKDTIRGDKPYPGPPGSPWGTSNVMAKVSGVTKTSTTVFPERRGNGWCARLDTRLENCKVLGLINITVLASGTVFLGEMDDPVKDTKNPLSKLIAGVPFKDRPTALMLDYKFKGSGEQTRTRATGFSAMKKVPGEDYAVIFLYLQKRWEDDKGNVYASRIGTAYQQVRKNTPDWINAHRIPVIYGNATSNAAYVPEMKLMNGENSYYTRNSKGKIVPIQETSWADAGEQPTHIMVQMSSSYDGAYVGTIGNSLWIDNVKLVY